MPTLNWIGKDKVISHHTQVPFRVLEHKYGYNSDNFDITSETHCGNKIIHGDNLEVLKALLPEYEGRINCIYIDPPYNTGNEGWIYNDNVNDPHIRKWLGEVVGKEGEDLCRHDKWLCMMYPRLVLMQKILHNKGVIFISIDDNECENLKLICDEIFGKNCFVANISWQRAYTIRNDSNGIPTEVEHLLVYSKNPGWQPKKMERTVEMNKLYKNPDNDDFAWTSSAVTAPSASSHQGMVYAIQHPFSGEMLYPTNRRCWTYQQMDILQIMREWTDYELKDIEDDGKRAEICGVSIDEVRKGVKAIVLSKSLEESKNDAQKVLEKGKWPLIYFTDNGNGGIRKKTYINNVEGKIPTNFLSHTEVGHSDEATRELKEIFDGACPFDTPKPTRLIQRILDIATDDDSIILDAFAGSGTTAHAVLKTNHDKHSHRKFVLIEMGDFADDTTAERIKRAITGYPAKLKHDTIIYNKKLTVSNLPKAAQFLQEAQNIIALEQSNYAEIGKPKLKDNCITVTASRVENGYMQGMGGSFDYYELGSPLFKDDDTINENVPVDKIREYIYYTETHQHLDRKQDKDYPYLLDYLNDTGYFFFYEREQMTTLSYDTLNIVPKKADYYVIYADTCIIDKEKLAQMGITFKKIPRDVERF